MPQAALTPFAVSLALLFAIVAFSFCLAQACTRRRLENRLIETEIRIREEDLRFSRARADIAAAIARGGGACRSETVIAVISQASPPVSERPSAIGSVNVGLTVK